MQRKTKSVVAAVIALVMVVCALPMSAFAAIPDWADTNVVFDGTSFGTNGYYNVISKKDYVLVPGAAVESEIVLNNSTGTRRQVIHVIEVDPSNPDISIIPGYNQIDKDVTQEQYWSHAGLTDMAKYYEDNLGYNIVGGMNTDLYYDTYAPRILVYNGKDLSVKGKTTPSQSILYVFQGEDGTVSCDVKAFNRADFDAYLASGRLLHAVSVSFGMVVNNGELVKKTEERTSEAAARSMVGVKADGTLVICMNDGRGANNSVGFCDYEEGEAMLALGCQWAANCDGGGSSTFLTKRVGEEDFTMRSVPCDGAQRPTSHGIFITSNVAPTGELDVVNITSDYDFFAPNTEYTFGAEAIDTHGYAMDMPADIEWALSDASFGTINGGKFVSNGKKGEIEIQVLSNGKVFGSKAISVADPTTFALSATSTVVPYSTADKIRTITLPIVSKIGEADVYYDLNAVSVSLSNDKAGVLDGYQFTATDDISVAGVDITVTYGNTALVYKIEFGKGSEILWDFENDNLHGFLGQQDAFDWQKEQGIENPMSSIITAGNASFDVHSKTFIATKENGGQVHNGKSALGIEFDMRYTSVNSWSYANIYNVSNTDGSGILRDVANGKKATTLGMWVYIPEGFYSSVNAGALAIRGDFVAGADAASATRTNFNATYNGKTINSLTENDIPDNRWIYVVFKLSGYNYVSINNSLSTENYSPCFARMYVKHHLAQKLTYYFDDFTLDYSSAVDDRNPPVITEPTYCVTDVNVAIADSTIASNVVSFNAKIADFAAANAEGLDYSTGAIYIDGVKLSGVSASGSNLTVENVTLNAGKHEIKFEIADKLGNATTLTENFVIKDAPSKSTITLSGHNDSNAPAEAGSIYYIDVKASDISDIKSVVTTLELQTANTWDLAGITVAPGFEVSYTVNPLEKEFVTFTITKTGECTLTGEQTILSIPVRIWAWDNTWVCDSTGATMSVEVRYTKYAEAVISVEADVRYGLIVYTDDSTGSFTDSFACATAMDGAAVNSFTWHAHDEELTVLNQDPTVEAEGFENRTYCESCKSVIDWGTAIPKLVITHNYEIVDGQFVCTDDGCGKVYESGTGLFEMNGKTYYSIVNKLMVGWQFIDGVYYYFDNTTCEGINGERFSGDICSTSQKFYYTFTNGKLDSGVWLEMAEGTRYYYGAGHYGQGTYVIDGKTYGFNSKGYRYEGLCVIRWNPKSQYTLFEYTEDGVYVGQVYANGVFTTSSGDIYYLTDGIASMSGLVQDDNGDYYYISRSTMTAITNKTYSVSNTNGLLPVGSYRFGADGKMLQGIATDENGKIRYYVDGKPAYAGLVQDNNGDYYYISGSTMAAVTNGTYNVSKTNGLLPTGSYRFGADGKMLQGIAADDNGIIRYYVDGKPAYAGLVQDDNGDYYYISGSTMAAITNRTYNVSKTNGLLPTGSYKFGADGKMLQGIVKENGKVRYYVDGKPAYAGLVRDADGSYYYISGSTMAAITNTTRYISFTNDLVPAGTYTFGEDGKMTTKVGVVKDTDGKIRYYVDGKPTYAGLVQDTDGSYYYISGSSLTAIVNTTRYITFTNGLLPEGTYNFGADGKMIIG